MTPEQRQIDTAFMRAKVKLMDMDDVREWGDHVCNVVPTWSQCGHDAGTVRARYRPQ